MKRILPALLCAFVILPNLNAVAETVGLDEARLAGERFLAHRLSRGLDPGWTAGARVAEMTPLERDGRPIGYLLSVEPQGHMIVSALRELPAVKAFSSRTNFDPAQADGYPALVQEVMDATLRFLEESYGSLESLPAEAAPARNRATWTWLLEGGPSPRDTEIVGPLLVTDWHQTGPFWDDCPPGDGGQCLVGCVATSGAQILKYWRYPDYGNGNHSYYWTGDNSCGGSTNGMQLSATFSDPYDWDYVLDSYASGYTPFEAAAVAELNYEVAVAFNMDFGHCASGTYVTLGETVYSDYFRYAEGAEMINRGNHTAEGWWQAIRHELDALPPRVMHYRINSHSIICDGYMDDGAWYYHMNYGWGGSADAWYALDNVYCPWEGCSYMVEGMVIGIEPEGYFTVSAPAAGEIWTHSEEPGQVTWYGSSAANVVLDLYSGDNFVTRLVDWTVNDGAELPPGPVDPAWGTGSQYRVKVVGDDDRFGWSEYFGIYGAAVWADASAAPLDNAGNSKGVAWGDCDGDGLPDIYLSNYLDSNRLYGNEGAGLFTDLTEAPLGDIGYCLSVAWADFDNDDDLDLCVAKTNGAPNLLFRNDGDAFVDVSAGPLGEDSFTSDVAWADYDGDGLVDLYLTNVYQADRLLHNEGGGVFSDATVLPLGNEGWGRSATWADYDGDGDGDLYLVRSSSNKLYRNEGAGVFTDVSLASGLVDGGNGFGAAWADYDNDGDLDVYVANEGANTLYRNEGEGSFSDVTAPPLDESGATRGVTWGDYDNDGWLDLYIASEGENKLFHNEGGAGFVNATDPLLGDASISQGAAWADFDGDGDLDLYLANEDQPNRLFQNDDSSSSHWLHLDLVGDESNASALGARVRLVAGGLALTRQVGGDAGYLSRNSLTVEFGLGDAAIADTLEIRWPGGGTQTLLAVAADQRLTVLEDSGTAVPDPAALALRLHGNYPNPFNPRTEIRFSLPATAAVELGVYDLAGRRVRTLAAGTRFGAGTHALSWDGRDDAGRSMPSGVYLSRLETGAYTASHKMLLLK